MSVDTSEAFTQVATLVLVLTCAVLHWRTVRGDRRLEQRLDDTIDDVNAAFATSDLNWQILHARVDLLRAEVTRPAPPTDSIIAENVYRELARRGRPFPARKIH